MSARVDKTVRKSVEVSEAEQGCELNISADKQWMRLIVSGALVASFHVNYVKKVLGTIDQQSNPKPHPKNRELQHTV